MFDECGGCLIPYTRETERDWDKDLAEDVKGECESKYGHVLAIKVEKESQVGPSSLNRLLCLIV